MDSRKTVKFLLSSLKWSNILRECWCYGGTTMFSQPGIYTLVFIDSRVEQHPEQELLEACISLPPLHRFYGKIRGLEGPIVAEGLVGEIEPRSQFLEQEVHATAEQADV